jgi:hypothetical protein
MDTVLDILQWIAVIFLAGLVGQLGKSLTLRILGELKARRNPAEGAAAAPLHGASGPEGKDANKARVKEEKKALKAQHKAEKKRRKLEEGAGS